MPDVQCPPEQVLRIRCAALNSGESGITIPELASSLAPFLGLSNITLVTEQQPSGVAGGTFTSGAWQTRGLNTVVAGSQNIRGLAGNQVLLFSSPYLLLGFACGFDVNAHEARIRDVGGGTTVGLGFVTSSPASQAFQTYSTTVGFISAKTPPSAVELQHQCITTKASDGFGVAGFNGDDELYSFLLLAKLDGPET